MSNWIPNPSSSTGDNGILSCSYAMPFKEDNADGQNSFSMGRQVYHETARANASFTPHIMLQKKWIGGNRDASQHTTDARTNAIGLGSMNVHGGATSFKNIADHNTERNARQRARSGGAVAPLKKGKSTNFF